MGFVTKAPRMSYKAHIILRIHCKVLSQHLWLVPKLVTIFLLEHCTTSPPPPAASPAVRPGRRAQTLAVSPGVHSVLSGLAVFT